MDLLIATAAMSDDALLVTRDRRHFTRIPDLELIDY
jgi:predicted nucleic acid-binding protein